MTKKLKRSYKEKHKKSVALKQIFARFFFGTNTKQVLLGSVGFPAFNAICYAKNYSRRDLLCLTSGSAAVEQLCNF